MPNNPFPYPGGKFYQADWVLEHLPEHHCYVEPFGGAATVLFTKDPSSVEVYNDKDDHLVEFFRTLWSDRDALITRLNEIPYSRELHEDWSAQFYGDESPPSDDVERATRFFYLRFSQQMSMSKGVAGFCSTRHRNEARKFADATDALTEFAERLSNVVIENKDYREIIGQYDGGGTVFYCDPPYVDSTRSYRHSEFDNDELTSILREIDGQFVLSCKDVPEELGECWVTSQETARRGGVMHGDDWEKREDERLVMNFDPAQTPLFESANQRTLTEVNGG